MIFSFNFFLWAFHLLTWLVSRYTAHWTKAYTYNERLCCFGICFPWKKKFDFLWLCSSRLLLVHDQTDWLVNCSHFVWTRSTDCSCLFSRCSLTYSSSSSSSYSPPQLPGSLLPRPSSPPLPPSSHSEGPSLPCHVFHLWHYLSSCFCFPSPSSLPFYDRSELWTHSVAPSMKAWKNQTPDHPSTTSWHTPSLG